MSPSSQNSPYTAFPVVSWSSANGTSVTVNGPVFIQRARGRPARLPHGGSGSVCTADPGAYTYVLTVTGAGRQHATLSHAHAHLDEEGRITNSPEADRYRLELT